MDQDPNAPTQDEVVPNLGTQQVNPLVQVPSPPPPASDLMMEDSTPTQPRDAIEGGTNTTMGDNDFISMLRDSTSNT